MEGVCLEHHADRSKSRGQYLPLLELAVEEDPNNDRNVHYLGREYFFFLPAVGGEHCHAQAASGPADSHLGG